ncbi:MAG: hypothetical protein KGH94_04435 [Candidatus Micrarchaeota archaeon]|nr:hypothetical protein [Candidatus Micrarchaeota archaeon]
MSNTKKRRKEHGTISKIDAWTADAILYIMRAENLGGSPKDADAFVKARNMAFSTILPEVQLVAINSNDRVIRSQAWMNMNLSPNVARLMRGKVGRDDKEMREVAARAQRYQLYLRRDERKRHHEGATARMAEKPHSSPYLPQSKLSPTFVPPVATPLPVNVIRRGIQ